MNWALLTGNLSAVVALIGAAITLGTFIVKDIIDRRRRLRLGLATLTYQIRLLAYAIDKDSVSAPLLAPNSLLPFADLYMLNMDALRAFDVFNHEYTRWQKTTESGAMRNSTEKKSAIQSLSSVCLALYPILGHLETPSYRNELLP